MIKQIIVWLIVLVGVLAGCSDTSTDESGGSVSRTITAQTPVLLRSIPISNLSVTVNVGGTEKEYRGSDFPDGKWLIDVSVQPSQMHTITVKWFDSTHMILEETGQFFADPSASIITLDLDYISAGFPRFDVDCDGQSNLDEIIAGTDVTLAEGTSGSVCDDPGSVALEDTEFPWILRQHRLFRAGGYTQRVTSYELPVKITSSNANYQSAFSTNIFTEPVTGESVIKATIQFLYHPELGKRMRFRINEASAFQRPDIEDANCVSFDAGFACNIPYQWQEEHWYDIKFEQKSSTNWQGVVTDRESDRSEIIGNFDTRAEINWYRAENGVSYSEPFTAQDCRLGLPPISVRYTPGKVNGDHSIVSSQVIYSDCVKAGAGWSEGVRTENEELMYSLTLGTK